MSTQVSIGRGTFLNRFCGPNDNPDRLRWEVYSDARGMNRSDVLELIIELVTQIRNNPAPTFEQELKFANDTTELVQVELRRVRGERDEAHDTMELQRNEIDRMRRERDEARRDLERVIVG